MFVKMFQQIYSSSIANDYHERLVFMDMLVLADQNGVVDMTHEGIARITNVPMEVVRKAISVLESPDPKSRNPTAQGRRIVRLDDHRDWGWMIVNYAYYRGLASEEQRRANTLKRVRRFRMKQNLRNAGVTHRNAGVTHVTTSRGQKQRQKHVPPSPPKGVVCVTPEQVYDCYPKKVAKPVALKSIAKAMKSTAPEELLRLTRLFAEEWKGCDRSELRFCPNPSTWFNQERFNDDPQTWKRYEDRKDKTRGRVNPRNEGICRGPTDYAALAKAKSALAHEEYLARVASSKAR